jgi:hypothetical protein
VFECVTAGTSGTAGLRFGSPFVLPGSTTDGEVVWAFVGFVTDSITGISNATAIVDSAGASAQLCSIVNGNGNAANDNQAYVEGDGIATAGALAQVKGDGHATANIQATVQGDTDVSGANANVGAFVGGSGQANATLAAQVVGGIPSQATSGFSAQVNNTRAGMLVVANDGAVTFTIFGLPTVDPANAGSLWVDVDGHLCVSAGGA